MAITTYIRRIDRIDQLIRLQATGSPKELADKLGISKRTVYEYIEEMKLLGAPIKYDKYVRSYVYRKKGGFTMCFQSQ